MGEDSTAGPTRFQVLATKGIPTFLLLEGANEDPRPTRRDAEGERLGALAMGIEGRLPPLENRPWPCGFAVTLGELAAGGFFPRGASQATPRSTTTRFTVRSRAGAT